MARANRAQRPPRAAFLPFSVPNQELTDAYARLSEPRPDVLNRVPCGL